MSLTKDHGNIVFQCDGKGCHETLETETSNFDSAQNALHRGRWRAQKPANSEEWIHLCGTCYAQVFVTLKDGTVI